ncbi:MAG: hypothetical protein HRT53_00435 [Colwellia sp.]|nr:hypothetical protein [Colwellia sp.]
MKIFNKIAVCTIAATIMVTPAQAIELVKVEPVAKFTITKAAKESLAQSMKLSISISISESASVNTMLNGQKYEVNYLSLNKTQTLAKTNVIAE